MNTHGVGIADITDSRDFTRTESAPDVDDVSPENANHYMNKNAILRSIVNGEPGRALCGDTFIAGAEGNGKTSRDDWPVCPSCQTIYDRLRP